LEEVKEKLMFVAPESPAQWRQRCAYQPVPDHLLTLSDEQTVTIEGSQLFEMPEILFGTGGEPNLADMFVESLQACRHSVETPRSVVLAGGNMSFPGLPQRLRFELRNRGLSVRIRNPRGPFANLAANGTHNLLACGADRLAKYAWTKEIYDELGPDPIDQHEQSMSRYLDELRNLL
jgi:hypothetical protein